MLCSRERCGGAITSLAALALVLLLACDRSESNTPAPAVTVAVEQAVEQTVMPATQQSARGALTWLEQQVRVPAGAADNPWALAHGLLAFGKDFKAHDGRSAVEVIASFAEHAVIAGVDRYAFPAQHNGQPVESHTYLMVKTFLEIGLDPSFALRTADNTTIDVRRLLTDMRAQVHVPTSDSEWHDAAWWLSALTLDATTDPKTLSPLRDAALARLEADDAPIAIAVSNNALDATAFSPEAPMGGAKRNKAQIYGHPCGGLHFVQAVLRAVGRNASPDVKVRAVQQVRLLLARAQAERALYAEILKTRPSATLMISAQQLKFFGHVLETLAVADELGLLNDDMAFAQTVRAARQEITTDVIAVVAQLKKTNAYDRLKELNTQQPQLVLDLIGDGCHAIHGLRNTLPVLPAP